MGVEDQAVSRHRVDHTQGPNATLALVVAAAMAAGLYAAVKLSRRRRARAATAGHVISAAAGTSGAARALRYAAVAAASYLAAVGLSAYVSGSADVSGQRQRRRLGQARPDLDDIPVLDDVVELPEERSGPPVLTDVLIPGREEPQAGGTARTVRARTAPLQAAEGKQAGPSGSKLL
jgi:hypothetical protein